MKEMERLLGFSWLHLIACRILVAQPGTEPKPLAMKALTPNHREQGNSRDC